MPADTHGFCTLHRIGYDRRLEAMCPQCTLHSVSGEQWDFHTERQLPIHPTTGNLHDPLTLKEALFPDNSSAKPLKAADA